MFWRFFASLSPGDKPFENISPAEALQFLRVFLCRLHVKNAGRYRTHDLRRGHAQDLVERGATLAEILRAGQWRSPAFLQYLDMQELEHGAVVEAHLDESSSEDEGD